LGDVISYLVMPGYVPQPRLAISDHHWPDLRQQRLYGGRLALGSQRGQLGDGGLSTTANLPIHAFPFDGLSSRSPAVMNA
jgi:hypothetical protein